MTGHAPGPVDRDVCSLSTFFFPRSKQLWHNGSIPLKGGRARFGVGQINAQIARCAGRL